jgi:hypothetical protein
MSKIKLDHRTMPEASCLARLREIINASTGNPAFVAIAAKVADLDTAVNVFDTKFVAHNATVQLGRQQLTERDDARVVAEAAAETLAHAAEAETQDDATLLSGGWHLRSHYIPPAGPPLPPQNLLATGGDLEGEVDLQWEPVYGRDAYLGEWAVEPKDPWTQFYAGTKSSCTATGLNPGQMYYFRVRAVGSNGLSPWSDIAQKRAS